MRPAAIHVRRRPDRGDCRRIRTGRRTSATRCRRAGGPARPRRHARAHERSRACDWEGVEHATRAAAAGGVTTVVDMPLEQHPGHDQRRRPRGEAAGGRAAGRHVDVGFWGGVVPGNVDALEPLARAGVLGLQVFSRAVRRRRVPARRRGGPARCDAGARALGLPLLVHAELPERSCVEPAAGDPRVYAHVAGSRPPAPRAAAIELLIALAREYRRARARRAPRRRRCDARAARGSRARRADHRRDVPALPDVRGGGDPRRRDGVQVRTADSRAPASRAAVAGARATETIDLIASDHSPAPPAAEAPRGRRLRQGVGRHRVAAARSARDLDRRQRARHSHRTSRANGWPRPRRGSRGSDSGEGHDLPRARMPIW